MTPSFLNTEQKEYRKKAGTLNIEYLTFFLAGSNEQSTGKHFDHQDTYGGMNYAKSTMMTQCRTLRHII